MKRLAIYLRLSLEDADNQGESTSISNQRKLLYDYIHQDSELCNYEVVEFCDDGYTGTNMDRPAMQKMLKEVKENRIQCIVVKDISRFSRDYIETGNYLNQIFPFMGIRFIALNDRYDSKKQSGTTLELDTAFKTLLYDLYSKDISTKVKASFKSKCENGEYVFGAVPFGYKKSETVKNKIVVEEKEAEVVRYIFSLAIEGMTSTQIAKKLYEENVPTITQMRKSEQKSKNGRIQTWSHIAVRNILNNRFYLGEMSYGKSEKRTVGEKEGVRLPKGEWKVIPNHHEALISTEIYDQVCAFRPENCTKRKREKHPLTGKIYCGGCGYSLNYRPQRKINGCRGFECRKHSLLEIPECCTYISAALLEEIVLLMLNKELLQRGNAVRQKKNMSLLQQAGIEALRNKISRCRKEKIELQKQKDMLYENYAFGNISKEEYLKKASEITKTIELLTTKETDQKYKLTKLEEEYQSIEDDMKQILRYSSIAELTQEVVDTFIKRVYVYKGKRVEIEWNFSMGMGISQSENL